MSSTALQTLAVKPMPSLSDYDVCQYVPNLKTESSNLVENNDLRNLEATNSATSFSQSQSSQKAKRIGQYIYVARDGTMRRREKIFKIIYEQD